MKRIIIITAISILTLNSCITKQKAGEIVIEDIVNSLSSQFGKNKMEVLEELKFNNDPIFVRSRYNPGYDKAVLDAVGTYNASQDLNDMTRVVNCISNVIDKNNPVWISGVSYSCRVGPVVTEQKFYVIDRKSGEVLLKYPYNAFYERTRFVEGVLEGMAQDARSKRK